MAPSLRMMIRNPNAVMMFVCALAGAICGTVLVNLVGAPGGSHGLHSLVVTGNSSPGQEAVLSQAVASDAERGTCPEWDLVAAVQKQMQHDYCTRHFDGRPRRTDISKTKLHLPDSTSVDFFLYKSADIVSGAIQSSGQWESHMSSGLVDVLTTVAERKGLPRERVHLLDIGGNVASHTVYVQAAGFSVLVFEPMPQNEDIVRSNLCVADPDQERVTYFTKGLGAKATLCKSYSHLHSNQGDGVVFCDGEVPDDITLMYRGQMEVDTLDNVLLPCNGGKDLPPDIIIGALKMDVEGFEPYVLKGARKFLAQARIPFIVFEIGRLQQEERMSVLRFLYDLGYQASTKGFSETPAQPEDLPGVEDVFLVLPMED